MSPSSRCGSHPFESPGRGGGRKGPGGSGRLAPGPLPAPHRAEELGPQFPQFLYLGAPPHLRHQVSTGISRNNLCAPRASCRLIQHSCGSARHQRSAVQTSWPAHLWHRSSKVKYNLAAIPPGLASLRLRTPYAAIVHVRSAPVSGGYGRLLASNLQSLPGVQDTAVPSVGAACVSQFPRWGPFCLPHPARFHTHQRRCLVLLFKSLCPFANTVIPRSTAFPRSLPWAVPAQAPESVCPPHGCRSWSGSGSPRSPSPCAAQAHHHLTLQTLSGANAPLRSASLVTARLLGGSRLHDIKENTAGTRYHRAA